MNQQPAGPKKKARWPWVLGGIFVVFALGMVGCVAVVATVADKAVTSFNAEQRRHAISQAQFDAVPLGASKAAVLSTLGKDPENTSDFSSQAENAKIDSSCVYYWESGRTFGHWYQFCFDGAGNLVTKNSF